MITPAAAARRQNTIDRMAEYLTEHGAHPDRAAAYARDLLDIAQAGGYALPPAFAAPPLHAPGSTDEGRRKARELFEATRRERAAGGESSRSDSR